VRRRIVGERLDDAAGCRHRPDRVRVELDARAVPRNGHHLVDGQRADADRDGLPGLHRCGHGPIEHRGRRH
jgi:hypothetical protein